MKKIVFPVICLVLLIASCQPDPVEPPPTNRDKILGKWHLDRDYSEYYQPSTVLLDYEEYIGEPEDSVVFRKNNIMVAYPEEEYLEYHFVNDSTISIDDEEYKIRKLTSTELYLFQEESITATDERYVIRGYLSR
jgi:hypothetical protein